MFKLSDAAKEAASTLVDHYKSFPQTELLKSVELSDALESVKTLSGSILTMKAIQRRYTLMSDTVRSGSGFALRPIKKFPQGFPPVYPSESMTSSEIGPFAGLPKIPIVPVIPTKNTTSLSDTLFSSNQLLRSYQDSKSYKPLLMADLVTRLTKKEMADYVKYLQATQEKSMEFKTKVKQLRKNGMLPSKPRPPFATFRAEMLAGMELDAKKMGIEPMDLEMQESLIKNAWKNLDYHEKSIIEQNFQIEYLKYLDAVQNALLEEHTIPKNKRKRKTKVSEQSLQKEELGVDFEEEQAANINPHLSDEEFYDNLLLSDTENVHSSHIKIEEENENNFFEKDSVSTKDVHHSDSDTGSNAVTVLETRKSTELPFPSPSPKIKSEIEDSEHEFSYNAYNKKRQSTRKDSHRKKKRKKSKKHQDNEVIAADGDFDNALMKEENVNSQLEQVVERPRKKKHKKHKRLKHNREKDESAIEQTATHSQDEEMDQVMIAS